MSTDVRQYDVCLSFASENGEYVQRVYELLKKKEIDVYFYKATRAKAWGRSLTSYLENIYRHQSKFCVIFLSKDYATKAWTQHELKSALVRAFEQKREYLLLVRFDDTKLRDLPDDIVYESSETPPEDLVDLIVEKIRDLPESTSAAEATSRPKCWNCAGWLNAGAKYCTLCHHYQDWRRRFHIIAAFLQQVDPLIKLIGGIVVVVTALLYGLADSSTTAKFVGADANAIELSVSNQGWKRSDVRRSVLEFPEPKMIVDTAVGPEMAVIATIPARDEKSVRLDVSALARGIDQTSNLEYEDEQIQEWLSRTKVRLWVEIQESDGTRQDWIDIDGDDLEPLVEKTETGKDLLMIGKRWLGLVIAVFCSAGLHAQTPSRPTMPKVPERLVLFSRAEVRIADSNCDPPDKVWLVIDDRDRIPYELRGSGSVRQLTLDDGIDPRNTQASIYFPHAMRTDCVKGMPDWENQKVIYTFPRCSSTAVHDITISTSHPISISYVRHLPAGDPGTVPCRARARFRTHEPYPVKQPLRAEAEDLVLQLGLTQPRLDAPGLSLREILRQTRGLTKDQSVPLDEERMIHVLSVQRARGAGSVPNVSPASIELDIRAVRELGSPELTLNIKKFEQKKK